MRLSDKILIIGNGGIKDSKTYNENNELNGYVMDLQKFDALIKEAVKDGSISSEYVCARCLKSNKVERA